MSGKTPEQILRELVEQLGAQRVREILSQVEAAVPPTKMDVLRTRICPTGRGAVFRLKRAVWAVIGEENLDEEKSKENWGEFARKLIEFLNAHRISERPMRITLYYTIQDSVFKPLRAEIEYFPIEPERITFVPTS